MGNQVCGGHEGAVQGKSDTGCDSRNQARLAACTKGGDHLGPARQRSSHNLNDDLDIVRECTADGWDIKFISQPPNSPDLNINSIQSLQDRTTPRTIDDLIAEVRTAFAAQTSEKLGAVWTTLQSILQEIMLAKGDNNFKLPHLKKAAAAGRGVSIPMELPCSQKAWEAAQSALPS